MDFLLIRQKDKILGLINKKKFREARICLDVLRELWETHAYEYKLIELDHRIDIGSKNYAKNLKETFVSKINTTDKLKNFTNGVSFICKLLSESHPNIVERFNDTFPLTKDSPSCRQITSQLVAPQETNPVSKLDTPSTP